MIICVSFNFLAFWLFPWQRQPFWKHQPLAAQLHMAYDIPTRFHKVWSRHLREIERTIMCGRIIIVKKKPLSYYYYYYYYYITPTVVGWCIAILRFFFTIIILPHIIVRSISRRCLDQTLWNLVGISYAMGSCLF
jgi:hypothetical protein